MTAVLVKAASLSRAVTLGVASFALTNLVLAVDPIRAHLPAVG